MKAKSWKKFVKQDLNPKKSNFLFDEDEKDDLLDGGEEDPLQLILEQNETLNELFKERQQLEQKMSNLTGVNVGGQDGSRPFQYAEIPSINEKKVAEKKREERRRRELNLLNKRRELSGTAFKKTPIKTGLSAPSTNLSPLEAKEPDTTQKLLSDKPPGLEKRKNKTKDFDFGNRKKTTEGFSPSKSKKKSERFGSGKKKKDNEAFFIKTDLENRKIKQNKNQDSGKLKPKIAKKDFDKVKSKLNQFKKKGDDFEKRLEIGRKKGLDELLFKDEKKRKKAKKTLDDLKKFGSDLQKSKKQLDKFNSIVSDDRFKDVFDDDLKNTLSTASKITDKIDKPFKKIKSNKVVEKFTDGWNAAKKKRLDASKVKSKYQKASDKLLRVDVGSFGGMQIKMDKLKEMSLIDRKKKAKEEKEREEKREARKKEREEKRKKEREKEKKEEDRREQKREERREKRRNRKKEND